MGPPQLKSLPRNLFQDQKNFWLTPFHMTEQQWRWTVPLAFVGAAMLGTDTAIERHVPTSPTTVSRATTVSNAGAALLVGSGAVMFLWGQLAHNEDQRETGLLAGEAAIDALAEAEAFKYMMGRERPFVGGGRGRFFQGGDSFPSVHSSVSWAVASVIAHEYPGPLTKVLSYGVATVVSAARVSGRNHFPSDVVVGSGLGWLIGRQVYKARHDTELPGADYGTFAHEPGPEEVSSAERASPYVPIDSWVYPAFERLAALGVLNSGLVGLRPWTRSECTRLLEEVSGAVDESNPDEASRLYSALAREFSTELNGEETDYIGLDSVYARVTWTGTGDVDHYEIAVSSGGGSYHVDGTALSTNYDASLAMGIAYLIKVVAVDTAGNASAYSAPDLATLDLYCDRVACAVGRLSTRVFGMEEKPGVELARELGRALQLTNILRDLDEDAEIGRLYLPGELLRQAGITTTEPNAAIADPRVDGACRALAQRALEYFAAADRLMRSKPRGRLLAPKVMETVYRTILRDMLVQGWAPPRRRVRIGKRRLLWIVVRCALLG